MESANKQQLIPYQDLLQLIIKAFVKQGITEQAALSVAQHLVQAEIDGQSGHGLSRIPTYMTQISSGKVNPKAKVKLSQDKPSFLCVDADCGFAFPAIAEAIEAGVPLARQQGALFISITNSHHAGVLGQHIESIAQQGLVALMMCNAPAAIAPWGGIKPVFGTNPLAFACPRVDADPLIIDLSLSRIARGKIVRARALGEQIPLGWALDPQGQPTQDPQAAIDGTMIPIGESKGAALALMVELLTAGLAGAHFGFEASSLLDGKGVSPRIAQAIIMISPDDIAAFSAKAERLFATILEQEGTRLPGTARFARRAQAEREGVTVFTSDYDLLCAML